jgi:phospholipase/carboxylesterase
LNGVRVLIIDGEKATRRPPNYRTRLAASLQDAEAMVAHHVLPVGHSITSLDRRIAGDSLASL